MISGKPEYELMQTAWRERNPEARIKAAKEAISLNPECATAYILLAEEEAKDITEAELKFREAYKVAEQVTRVKIIDWKRLPIGFSSLDWTGFVQSAWQAIKRNNITTSHLF